MKRSHGSFRRPASEGVPEIYWPVEEAPPPMLTFVAKVEGQPENYSARCRDAVRTINPQVPIYDVKTLHQRLTEVLARPRFYTTATGFLAVLGMLLAVVRIYGAAAYSIARRRHEIGVRMAVGASYRHMREMILQESMRPIVVGMVAAVVFSVVSVRCWTYVLAVRRE